MTLAPPVVFRKHRWQVQPYELDEDLIARCLRLWDQGHNTHEIARIMFQPEHIVERATRLGRERRRMEESDATQEKPGWGE